MAAEATSDLTHALCRRHLTSAGRRSAAFSMQPLSNTRTVAGGVSHRPGRIALIRTPNI